MAKLTGKKKASFLARMKRGRKKAMAKVKKVATKVKRSAAALARGTISRKKPARGSYATKAELKKVADRLTKTERNVEGLVQWAGATTHALKQIYSKTGHALPGGTRQLGAGR